MGSAIDGCWRYTVVFASFYVILMTCGIVYSAPVLVTIFEEQFGQNFTAREQSYLGATMLSSMSLSGLMSLPLLRYISCRGSVVIGGLLVAIGPAVSVFAKDLFSMCLSLGGITGVGVGFAFLPALISVELHFPHRGNRVATGLALSGIGGGIAAFPPCLNLMIENVDWKVVILSLAGAMASVPIFGLFLRPPQRTNDFVSLTLFSGRPCKTFAFVALLVSHFVWTFGSSIIYVHLPWFARNQGYSGERVALLLTCMGILSFFSRGIFRVLHLGEAAAMDNLTTVICTLGFSAIFTGLFDDFSTKYAGLISYAMLFGFYCGFWSNFVNQVTVDVIGAKLANSGSGYAMLVTGLGALTGPPAAGWLYDETLEYKNIFYLSGSCLLFCSLLLMYVKLGHCPTACITTQTISQKISASLDRSSNNSSAGNSKTSVNGSTTAASPHV